MSFGFGINWLPQILFALDICLLLFSIKRFAKIWYSQDKKKTRFSFLPISTIILYLCFEAVELIMLIYQVNTFPDEQSPDALYQYTSRTLWVWMSTFNNLKVCTFWYFVGF